MMTSTYVAQTVDSLLHYLETVPAAVRQLGGKREDWRVREVGDGNLNLVFIVHGADHSVVVKQALPYLRCVGESWPLTLDRAWFEYEALVEQARHAPARVPAVYHFDRIMGLVVMEYLTPHIILRKGLIRGVVYPLMARHIGEFMAETLFKTSDFYLPAARKKERMALFCQNTQLCKITEDLVFTDPYRQAPLNRHTTPQLDGVARSFQNEGPLKVAAQELKYAFLTHAEAMIHGDLHTGSVMVTESETCVIDPEFAFYGPMGFDIGAFIANLVLAWCAQPAHASRQGEREEYRRWILDQTEAVWSIFRERFSALWRNRTADGDGGDAFPPELLKSPAGLADAALQAVLSHIWQDTVGFAGLKMIRRILGLAHVEDLESIPNPEIRAACELRALMLARRMLTDRTCCPTVKALRVMVEDSEAKIPGKD
ncbi:MAG: S-methyl-5-thioribose kinase [Thermoguttaceae bacterium]